MPALPTPAPTKDTTMTDPSTGPSAAEEKLIADVQQKFSSFFRWVSFLNESIKKDIGPEYGLIVNNPEVNAAEQRVSGTLDVSRRFKEPMSIPFSIQGDTISFQHLKFERENKATGQKSSTFNLSTLDDANRILGDVIQDYIG
jgi:hypothetical protein